MAPRRAALFTRLHADALICLHSEMVMLYSQFDLSLHRVKTGKIWRFANLFRVCVTHDGRTAAMRLRMNKFIQFL